MKRKTGKPSPDDPPAGLDGLDDLERFADDSSEAPQQRLGADQTLRRLLDDTHITLTSDETRGTTSRIQPNPVGLKKGYDPYDSGMLVKKQREKKKDLQRLSDWIQTKKKLKDDR